MIKQSIISGTVLFAVTQVISYFLSVLFLWPLAAQWHGYRPLFMDGISFLLHPASNILNMLLSFFKQYLLLQMFSEARWVNALVDLAGWILIAGYVLKRGSQGLPVLPVSPETQALVLRRFRMLGGFAGMCLVCLAVAGILFFIASLVDPQGFDGRKGLAAIGLYFGGKAHTNILASALCVTGAIIAFVGISAVWFSLYIFFTGHSHAFHYLCPHCGEWLETGGDLPDPDTVFKCPECGRSIRRDTW